MTKTPFLAVWAAALALALVAVLPAEAAKPAKGGGRQETVITSTRLEYDCA